MFLPMFEYWVLNPNKVDIKYIERKIYCKQKSNYESPQATYVKNEKCKYCKILQKTLSK